MDITHLSLLYKMKDKVQLQQILEDLMIKQDCIDKWFTDFNLKYSNSVLMKSNYHSEIRKPYNAKWLEFETNILLCRSCQYYLEMINE